jgi:hypothetical protein
VTEGAADAVGPAGERVGRAVPLSGDGEEVGDPVSGLADAESVAGTTVAGGSKTGDVGRGVAGGIGVTVGRGVGRGVRRGVGAGVGVGGGLGPITVTVGPGRTGSVPWAASAWKTTDQVPAGSVAAPS